MPTYEYRCEAESHHFDLRQSFDSDPVIDCPQCGSISRRVFHVPAVVFKGSGFYVNDYGKKGGNMGSSSSSGNGKSSSDGESSASKSESKAKSDSKPDAKKATASSDS